MELHVTPPFTFLNGFAAAFIAIIYISLMSLVAEPNRQKLNAIILAGAGAAYLRGGFGAWEFAFCTLMTFVAFKGLGNYRLIAFGWLLHTCWDLLHHLYGNAIVPFDAGSSAGCAVCDSILAIWFFKGAPNVFKLIKRDAKTVHA